MSWKVINTVIGLASIDQDFCRDLLADPLKAIERHGFSLTCEEKDVFRGIQATDIHEFSQYVHALLGQYPDERD